MTDEERGTRVVTDEQGADAVLALAASAGRVVGRGWKAYRDPDDDTQRRAGRSIVMDLSSVAERLPEDLRFNLPGLPWREVLAARDMLLHDGPELNARLVWNVLAHALPSFADTVAQEADTVRREADSVRREGRG